VPEGNWFVPALVAAMTGQAPAGVDDAEVKRGGNHPAQSG